MISIIICSIDDRKFFKVSQNYAKLLEHEPFEIIGIHDAKSLAEGYNRGIAQSSGSILIFSHDDIEILSPDFTQKIKHHLGHYDVVGVAGTSCLTSAVWLDAKQPHIHGVVALPDSLNQGYVINVYGVEGAVTNNIQALDGLFFAVSRTVAEALQFDSVSFDGFHCYDLDFTFRAYLAGYRLAIINEITIIHESDGSFNDAWASYSERFMQKYLGRLCIEKNPSGSLACARVSSKDKVLECCNLSDLIKITGKLRSRVTTNFAQS